MPKVKWIGGKKPKPFNALAAVLRGYKLASGLTSAEIGERLGVTPEQVRTQIGKPADSWTVGTIKRYCAAIGCPVQEAMEAAGK